MPKFDVNDLSSLVYSNLVDSIEDIDRDPVELGLPDFFSTTDVEERRALIKDFVESKLKAIKKGRAHRIKMIPKMVDLIYDLIYQETDSAILWKPRGSGGSVCAALAGFLMSIYFKMSFIILASSEDQSGHVFEYIKGFFECLPSVSEAILKGKPRATKIEFKNGVEINAVPASEGGSIGEHIGGLIVDESSSGSERFNNLIQRVIGITDDSEEKCVILCSTFHVPTGVFADTWEEAEEKGYRRYNYDIFDAMMKCTIPDKKGFEHCKVCELTNIKKHIDGNGNEITEYTGCNGKAYNSSGFKTFSIVAKTKRKHKGTAVWDVEYECAKPGRENKVYNIDKINACTVNKLEIDRRKPFLVSVGIDWGWTNLMALTITVLQESKCKLVVANHFQETPVKSLAAFIEQIVRDMFGLEKHEYDIFADAENQFNNNELHQLGFNVTPVPFSLYKNFGISNIQRWLEAERLEFLKVYKHGKDKFHKHLVKYSKNPETGKPIKKDDHYPDSFLCSMLKFNYLDIFSHEFDAEEETEEADDSVFIIG